MTHEKKKDALKNLYYSYLLKKILEPSKDLTLGQCSELPTKHIKAY